MLPTPSRHVVIDVETTGLSPRRGHRIVEVGAIAIEEGRPREEFCSLVKIDRKIPPEVQRIHGITDEMLAGEPGAEEVLPRLYAFLGDGVIVAHNARFDLGFLRHEFGRLSLSLKNRSVCTLEMCRRLYPRLPDYKLDTVYRHLFGEIRGDIRRHRALDDAWMAARIWMVIQQRIN
ncbi:MAG: 3'-5' exonuclease [Deltaproteobacteria bacterium]|nr:3'-5' exonuclease [Deltaproteobacteria bacterium]